MATPTLFHPDLHKRNIYVSEDDPTIVTDIIDWQASSIEPLFMYASDTPDFASPPDDTSIDEQQSVDNTRKDPSISRLDLCARAYEVAMLGLMPKLATARRLDDDLLRLFHYCHRSWRDGIVTCRQELIELARRWEELDLPGSCPYTPPSPEDMDVHQKDYKLFEVAQDLKHHISDVLDVSTEGWVPSDAWEATRVAHEDAYAKVSEAVKAAEGTEDGDLSVKDLNSIWPFDLPVEVPLHGCAETRTQ